MRKYILFVLTLLGTSLFAQSILTLDSCRQMALRANGQLSVAEAAVEKTRWEHKAARTKYYPRIDFNGGYLRTGNELSLLSDDQKNTFANLGTNLVSPIGQQLGGMMATPQFGQVVSSILAKHPELTPLVAQLPTQLQQGLAQAGGALNSLGQQINDAFRTDTRNITAGMILLTQPLYMGGKIRAYDKITGYAQQIAEIKKTGAMSDVVLEVDKAYWQIVNLSSKHRLAVQYRDMLSKLDEDVKIMIKEGVATKANELNVSVKLNEAEMTVTKVEDGLVLSRMLLCQLCGLPLDSSPILSDENSDNIISVTDKIVADPNTAFDNRAELKQLELAGEIYKQKELIARSEHLPSLALMGGYGFSNPSLGNGFENRFRGTWGVGVLLKVPIWNWMETRYKVKAAKAESLSYQYQLSEAREKIELQVNQQSFRVNEALRKYDLSLKNLEKAQENLRVAQLGHKEGVITTTDLLAAQTAWLSAQSDKIDAQVDIHVTRATLKHVLGTN